MGGLFVWTESDLWGATKRHEMRSAAETHDGIMDARRRGFVFLYASGHVQVLANRAEGTVLVVEKSSE